MIIFQMNIIINFSVNSVHATKHTALNFQLITTSIITPLADTNVTNVLRCFMRSMSWNLILTHTGHGYKCTYPKCDRIYKSQAEYNRHLLTYTQPKDKVRCHVCDKAFDLKKYLDEHLKKHEDKLLEECPHCGKRFQWCSSLGIHSRLKHPDLAPKKK